MNIIKTVWGKKFGIAAVLSVGLLLGACTKDEVEKAVDKIDEEVIEVAILEEVEVHEEDVLQYFHEITHGYVAAGKKWGAKRELNEATIENLRNILESNSLKFTEDGYLMGVLDEWEDGDFMNMVEVHNYIWDVQGGTTGYASELMSGAGIIDYHRMHFGTKAKNLYFEIDKKKVYEIED